LDPRWGWLVSCRRPETLARSGLCRKIRRRSAGVTGIATRLRERAAVRRPAGALIEDMTARSRGLACPSDAGCEPSRMVEGAGKAGRRLTPMVRVQQISTRQNHRISRIVRPSLRDGVTAYTRSPRGPGCLAPVAGGSSSPPAWPQRREARTTRFRRPRHAVRPQAFARCSTSRPSHSAANVRDDRDTSPAVQRNAGMISLIWADREAIYVFQKRLTAFVVISRFARRAERHCCKQGVAIPAWADGYQIRDEGRCRRQPTRDVQPARSRSHHASSILEP
jgi:hypothetical protein